MFKCFFLSWLNVFALFNFSSSTTFMSIFTFVFDWLDFVNFSMLNFAKHRFECDFADIWS